MPENTAAPAAEAPPMPAATAETPAVPQGNSDAAFQARAIAAMKAANASKEEPAAETPAPAAAGEAPPAKEEAKDAPKPNADPFHEKFAYLKAEERRLRQAREAEKAESRAEREALAREGEKLRALKDAKEALDAGDYDAAANKMGIPYDEWTKQKIGTYQPKAREVEKPKADPALDALRQEVEQLKAERMQQAEATAIANYRASLQKHAQSNTDKYELVNADPDMVEEALNFTMSYAKQHGHLPAETMEEALDVALGVVEKRWEEKLSERLLQTKKVRAKLPGATPSQQQAGPKTAAAKTLSTLAAGSAPPPAQTKPLRDEDYLAEAMKVLRRG